MSEKNKSNVIREMERRWIKPTIITVLIILVPVLLFGLVYGPTITKAMSEHDASFGVAYQTAKRKDKAQYFKSTPNVEDDPIITTEKELPDNPVLVIFYLHHCPYCEVSYESIKYNTEQLESKYKSLDGHYVYVEVNSPLGVKLRSEHNIEVASSMLLLAEHESDNMIVGSAQNDSFGRPTKDTENILKIFKAFDKELGKQNEYKNQRERVN